MSIILWIISTLIMIFFGLLLIIPAFFTWLGYFLYEKSLKMIDEDYNNDTDIYCSGHLRGFPK